MAINEGLRPRRRRRLLWDPRHPLPRENDPSPSRAAASDMPRDRRELIRPGSEAIQHTTASPSITAVTPAVVLAAVTLPWPQPMSADPSMSRSVRWFR